MKKRILIPWKVVVLVIFSILLSYTFAHAVDLAAEFDGPGSDYCDAANWDIMVIPCNAGSVFFDVNIPGIFSVNACGSSCEVNIFLLENNSSFIIPGGSSYIPLVSADIYGIINSTGGTFNATGVGAAFPGNRARVWASAGGQVVIGAPTYSSTGLFTNGNSNWTLFSASNLGTLLDLSALQSIDAGFNDGDTSYNATVHKITASDSGIIDLSGLATVTAPSRWDDRIEFTVNGNASINLSSLGTIATAGRGQTKFIVSNAVSLSLPALQTASHVMFDVSSGSTVTADGSPAAYSSTGLFTNGNSNWTLFSAANPGTLLDLSALQSLNAGFNDGDTSYNATVHKITASDSGIIDLSGLTSVATPVQPDDRLEVNISGEGKLILGTLCEAGRTPFTVNGPNTTLEVQGDVCFLNDPVTLTMSEATLKVSGDLPFSFTNEENFVAGDSIVHFNGDSEQLMEVGGLNVDVMVEFLTNDNFGFGQMILGQIGQPTVVRLIDEADNGNGFIGCRQSEALYLFGLGEDDPNGLKIVGGSTLILDRINLYALEEGEWIHINKLFLPGEKRIFYGDGFIEMGAVPGDTDANGALDGNDLAVLTMEFGRSDCTEADPCQSDFYGDGDVDKDDLACFANNFGRLDY